MPLPNYLAIEIEGLRSEVEKADGPSVQLLYKNSDGALQTIRERVANPEEIDDMLSDTLRAILSFAKVVQQRWQHGEAGKADIDRMRHAALANIEALETALGSAQPSFKARHLLNL